MIKLNNKQELLVNSIHRRFNQKQIKESMDIWLPLVDSKVWISGNSDGAGYDLGKEFPGCFRKDIYDVVVNDNTHGKTYVTVPIPSGDGLYTTVCRSGSGNLVLGDKRYQSYDVLKRHNGQVPGGLTFEELSRSPLRWVLQFAEVVND